MEPRSDTRSTLRDNVNGRALTGAAYTDTVGMTVESCVNFCNGKSLIYAGVEYAQECCKSKLSHCIGSAHCFASLTLPFE
jgi:hypothetical protein